MGYRDILKELGLLALGALVFATVSAAILCVVPLITWLLGVDI